MYKQKYLSLDDVRNLFLSYRNEVKNNPRKKMVFVGKDGTKEFEELERPLTYTGFLCYCYEQGVTIHHYFDNPDGAYDDYREVCTRIRNIIRDDQITGGMVGQYNSSITQRLNGLTDKREVETDVKIKQITGMVIE